MDITKQIHDLRCFIQFRMNSARLWVLQRLLDTFPSQNSLEKFIMVAFLHLHICLISFHKLRHNIDSNGLTDFNLVQYLKSPCLKLLTSKSMVIQYRVYFVCRITDPGITLRVWRDTVYTILDFFKCCQKAY